jgi:2-amino-4-hydroxy-6-hydroxymethyldihydropteridine diphosphokinase
LKSAPNQHAASERHHAYLSLGSNTGDRTVNLKRAIRRLSALGTVIAVSSFYETEPVEYTTQPWFLNCAVALETDLPPQELISRILSVEEQMGRTRVLKKGPRTIDIDIVLYNSMVMASQGLAIPHPAMHERRFVLQPLSEIVPEARHPVLHRTVLELLAALPPGQTVRRSVESPSREKPEQEETGSGSDNAASDIIC